jgi:DNA-binding IclR family transcriptional regulator
MIRPAAFRSNSLNSALTPFPGLLRLLIAFGLRSGCERRSTGKTITEMPALEKELELIGQRGYAADYEESAEGACCIGSSLRNCTGMVIGAISTSMKASRFRAMNQNRLASVVNAAAEELSGMLGYDCSSVDHRHAG